MRHLNVFCSNNMSYYAQWIPQSKVVSSIYDADLVIFEGGADINPAIYHAKKNKKTTYIDENRDANDLENFRLAVELQTPILGICRGAQLSCAMAGGKLIQDQNSGSSVHPIKVLKDIYDEKKGVIELETNSMHHQAMYPFNLDKSEYKIIGWTEGVVKGRTMEYENTFVVPLKDCEIVYFNVVNALGIQGHPEQMIHRNDAASINFLRYCRSLVLRLVQGDLSADGTPF